MGKRGPAPVVRHSFAVDPNPEKVQAALQFWRQALARKMAMRRPDPGSVTALEAEPEP